ncbi:MAG TPA: DUF2179 domain-containing protein [Spirochaetota bacterium]|nr:DUF2179 domain-containing protein [Spirochaetota bacterium]HOS32542.1 DUF2179 domain-containing protein [Spirochaetota bacterium]HOS56000.1 DUF2179 domain-containing protein [Spirochaetota bacterium]HPK61110.1 DUF2179 domain-containing protein [Spirochaetota bacterium]HQF76647.1 DUF2179 domain-containing protein [Spirochaetota bacterium]
MDLDFIFKWFILPLLIFLSRIFDVSFGTLRVVLITKGYKYIAPILGFFEVLLWITVAAQLISAVNNFLYYVAYAGGFAFGTFVGIKIESKLSIGTVIFRIMAQGDSTKLLDKFQEMKYGVTKIQGFGSRGPVDVIFTIVKRKKIDDVITIIKEFNPKSFYTIEDIKFASHTGFMPEDNKKINLYRKLYKPHRKSK